MKQADRCPAVKVSTRTTSRVGRLGSTLAVTAAVTLAAVPAQNPPGAAPEPGVNLALVVTSATSFVSGQETITALNDGFDPRPSDDKSRGAYGNWAQSGTQWVQYDWSQPISTRRVDVHWFDDRRGVRLPKACRLKYWNLNPA